MLGEYAPWTRAGAKAPANPLFDDAATGLHPWMARLLEKKELLMTPSVGLGAVGPLAGVFGLLSPATLLPFAALPRALALSGMALLDMTFGFLAFYMWRRNRGDAELPASIGAAVWGFAPARAVYRSWPYAGVAVLFPLLLLAVDLELAPEEKRPPAARRALLWAALALGLVLGGHPAFGFLGLDAALAYGAARALLSRTARRRPRLFPALAGAALALLATAPVLALGRDFLTRGEWPALRAPIRDAPPVPWRMALLLFDPYLYGNPAEGTWRGLGWTGPDNLVELQPYAGLATLLLAPLAFASARRREAAFWGALAAAAALAILAGGPFAAAAHALPGLGLVFLSRVRLLALFAAAVLAALGASVLLARRRLLVAGLLLFLVCDLSLANVRFEPHPAHADAPPPRTPALDTLSHAAPGNGRRFLAFGDAVVPNEAFELGLEDVRAHLLFTGGVRRLLARLDPLVYGRRGTFLTFERETFRFDGDLLDVLGVSALLAPHGTAPPGGDFRLAREGEDADVYERRWTPPARFDAGRVASFEAEGTRWRLRVDTQRGGALVLGRTRLPLLDDVRIDGRLVRAYEDAAWPGLLALDVPAGVHEVVVAPRLPSALTGASLAGALGLAALGAAALRARRPDNVSAA